MNNAVQGPIVPQRLNSLDIHLFDDVLLDASELKSFERDHGRLFKQLIESVSNILGPRLKDESNNLVLVRTQDGQIRIGLDRGQGVPPELVSPEATKELEQVMAKICVVAKQQFPSACSPRKEEIQIDIPPDRKDSPAPFFSDERIRLQLHSNTIFRNVFLLAAKAFTLPRVISIFVSAVGILYLNWKGQATATKSLAAVQACGDTEGGRIARITKIMACARITTEIVRVANNILPFFNISSAPSLVLKGVAQLGNVVAGLAIAVQVLTLGSMLYQGVGLSKFRSNLQQICNWGASEHAQAVRGLEFLRQELILTDVEELEIEQKCSDKGLNDEEKGKLVKAKLAAKYNALERKVGDKLAPRIATESESLLEQLNGVEGEDVKNDALKNVKQLISDVDKSSFTIRTKQITSIVISIVTISVLVISLFTTGPIVPILFIVAPILSSSIDCTKLHEIIGRCLWKGSKNWHWNEGRSVPEFKVNALRGSPQDMLELQNAFNIRSRTTDFRINGKPMMHFDDCLKALGLPESLKGKLPGKQEKALEWLKVMLSENIETELLHSPPQHSPEALARGRLTVGVMYNLETGVGRIRLRQEMNGNYPNVWGEITDQDARVWNQAPADRREGFISPGAALYRRPA